MHWLVAAALAADTLPIEITVTDPKVTTVIMTCGGEELRATVRAGQVSFPRASSGCTIQMIRQGGSITSPGKWTCDLDSCRQDDVAHTPVSNAPQRVNVILTTPMPAGYALEIACPDGSYRERHPIVENTVVFDGVPSQDCTLSFKGGVPAVYRPIKYGTWYCALSGATAVCTLK